MAKQRGLLLAARDKRVRPAARRQAAGRLERPCHPRPGLRRLGLRPRRLGGRRRRRLRHHRQVDGRGRRALSRLGRRQARRAGLCRRLCPHGARPRCSFMNSPATSVLSTAAKTWVKTLDSQFWDEARGGYYFTANDAERLIIRTRMIYDQPAPSANGAMIAVLTKLALITGENSLRHARPGHCPGLCRRVRPQLHFLPAAISTALNVSPPACRSWWWASASNAAHPGTDPRHLGQGAAQPAAGPVESTDELPARPSRLRQADGERPAHRLSLPAQRLFGAHHQRRGPEPGPHPAASSAARRH